MNGERDHFQVAVIGGGPAGLAAALTLSRSMMSTVLFDSPAPARNGAASHVGAFPGHDRAEPEAVRQIMRDEIDRYGYTQSRRVPVVGLEEAVGGFRLTGEDGSRCHARRVLLAVGMVDVFPAICGLEALWGKQVINCPFCDGFEVRDRPWGILTNRADVLAAAEIYRNWTSDLIMFVDPDIAVPAARVEAIKARGISLVHGKVTSLEARSGALSTIVLDDGRRFTREVLLVLPRQTQCELVKTLHIPLDAEGYVKVDETYQTGKPGIYGAGDVIYAGHQNVNTAIHMGNMAAACIVIDLCQQTSDSVG